MILYDYMVFLYIFLNILFNLSKQNQAFSYINEALDLDTPTVHLTTHNSGIVIYFMEQITSV